MARKGRRDMVAAALWFAEKSEGEEREEAALRS